MGGRLLAARAVLLCLTLALVPLNAGAAEPFEINAIVSMTGGGAFLGKNTALALGVIEASVNRSGGIGGRPIKFIIQDDASNPQTSVQLLNAMLAKNPAVVLGSNLVASCNAMAALTKSGPVVYCFSGGMHPEKGSYMFAYGGDTAVYSKVALRYLHDRGWTHVAILSTTDASGKDGEHVTDLALADPEFKDMVVVDREYFAPNDVSVSAQITKIKASGAQALILWGTGAPIGTAFNAMKQGGLDVPTAISSSNVIYAQMKQFAPFLPRQLYSASAPCVAGPELPRGALKDAVNAYVDAFKPVGVRPDISQSVAYDPALIVLSAFKKLGLNANATQIRDYIAGLHDWVGAVGQYDFRDGSQKGTGESSALVVRWDADGDRFVGVSKLGGTPLAP
jgi:branched-chain amino acid transport system substrate-binding protein